MEPEVQDLSKIYQVDHPHYTGEYFVSFVDCENFSVVLVALNGGLVVAQ